MKNINLKLAGSTLFGGYPTYVVKTPDEPLVVAFRTKSVGSGGTQTCIVDPSQGTVRLATLPAELF